MMEKPLNITQSPVPGMSRVMYCGDCVTFTLQVLPAERGRAYVRTNLGTADTARREIIRRVERNEIKLDEAWYDVEMAPKGEGESGCFEIVLPLCQTGYFQAKCLFVPEGHETPVWPAGDNCIFNVEPAGTCCANIIYNAFVRQFGKTRSGSCEEKDLSESITRLDEKGYTVIPESGKFRDLIKEVPFIFGRLGCRVLHLLPIHPTPTTYARMGRFGSPYAALNFTEVDPALAVFDPSATPLEQFMELVDAVHFHNGYLFLDMAINHTGWAASIHESNPEWLVRDETGKIEAPGAWGVVWADLTLLDYTNVALWQYMAEVFLLWCHRGVDGFRCDAGYMVPVEAWEYIVAKVREEYPDVLFFLEGLGGPMKTTCRILSRANFNWAYSELFQNYTAREISEYLPQADEISNAHGHMIHFAETHDNNRLASVSKIYAKMRTSLSALFSVCGGFGFANGVEWYATEKINVHESAGLNWGASENQVDHLSRLNLILKRHPAFFGGTSLRLVQKSRSECLALLRHHETEQKKVLVLVNLDCDAGQTVSWSAAETGFRHAGLYDLLSNEQITADERADLCSLSLNPGEVMALTQDVEDLALLEKDRLTRTRFPDRVYRQKLMAKALSVHIILNGYGNMAGLDIEKASLSFAADPVEFVRSQNPSSNESRVIVFDFLKDLKRQVMVPPGFFFLVRCSCAFRAEILDENRSVKKSMGYEEGIPVPGKNEFFTLFAPLESEGRSREYALVLRVFESGGTRVEKASILWLAPFDTLFMSSIFTRKEIVGSPFLKLLGTTKQGGMMRAAAWWGRLDSRYDALLAANMSDTLPENRWMVLARCRIWAVFQGYSRELAPDCLERFWFSYEHGGKWLFHIPTSEGKYYAVALFVSIAPDRNRVCLTLEREKAPEGNPSFLSDDKKVTLIIRPDIEDRSFHETVKAYTGPEHQWPGAVAAFEKGFSFRLSNGKRLHTTINKGQFVHEPEWHYMVHRPLEAERGMDADSDLFSPGYFSFFCRGGDGAVIQGRVTESPEPTDDGVTGGFSQPFVNGMAFSEAVYKSLDAFLVNRGPDKSVIAGYPWFLDWGRDSLIFCRGLIELGRFDDARAVLRLFGRFEDHGTLPNMICGENAQNRETSDAPLWFFACCRDLTDQEGSLDFLEETLDNRTIRQILLSIAASLIKGTRTGVKADPETLLLYSPSHFTWMDTNFPAGSPRQGYPVEIQALWYNALDFLSKTDAGNRADWQNKAEQVRKSVLTLFYRKDEGFFSDCLHAEGPIGAKMAVPDDALRPNQLFLLTLGVVTDQETARKCVETCLELLVPGAIRSLANRKLVYPLRIFYNDHLVKDPHSPYSGTYKGDEDTQRKPAYHNGTAWSWQFPVFCEAWAAVFGKNSFPTCLAWLGSVMDLMRKGAAGYIPEILDGDFPHTPRGCDAQAWSTSEVARVMHKLTH